MEIKGTLVAKLPIKEKEYNGKVYKSQEIVIEYQPHEKYPGRILLNCSEKTFDYISKLSVGEEAKATYDASAKYYTDKATGATKYFAENKCWKIEGTAPQSVTEASAAGKNVVEENMDLPF